MTRMPDVSLKLDHILSLSELVHDSLNNHIDFTQHGAGTRLVSDRKLNHLGWVLHDIAALTEEVLQELYPKEATK